MDQNERCQTVAANNPANASALVYMWVRSKVINLREFRELYKLIDQRCECEDCGGTRGGVPGNENIVEGRVLCDHCTADRLR